MPEMDTRPVSLSVRSSLGGSKIRLGGGHLVEKSFTVAATIDDPDVGEIEVEIEVEIVRKRALAHSVKVTAEPDVSSTVLRKVPIRELIAFGLRPVLWRETEGGGMDLLVAAGVGIDDDAIAAIRRLVGYVDEEDIARRDGLTVVKGKALESTG